MKKSIPHDSEELLKLLREQQERNAAQQETILKMAEQMEKLQHRLDKLLHLLYGTQSEKKQKSKPEISATSSDASVSTQGKKLKEATSNANGRDRCQMIYLECVLSMMCQRSNEAARVVGI